MSEFSLEELAVIYRLLKNEVCEQFVPSPARLEWNKDCADLLQRIERMIAIRNEILHENTSA